MTQEVVSYKVDPGLNLRVVTSFDGTPEYRCLCRKIGGVYYVKGKDVVSINGLWYMTTDERILFDHEVKQWVTRRSFHGRNGVVDFNSSGAVMGHFSYNAYNNVTVYFRGNHMYAISEEVALKFCVESPARGFFIARDELSNNDLKIKNFNNNQQHTYNADDDPGKFSVMKDRYNKYDLPIKKAIKRYSKYLEDISFGTEIECIRGYMPDHILNRTGTIICRDGSLRDDDETQGPEYTTVPYSGAKGVAMLNYLAHELVKRNQIDKRCSMHIHIGNIPTTRTFMVCLYMLAYQIQDEMFSMFPYYKNNEVRLANKNKNYCQKLDKMFLEVERVFDKESYHDFINDTYLRIYKFLLEGALPSFMSNRKNKRHPRAAKWERHARYYWVNFINLVTSDRNTVEFRLHTATMNSQKIITWLFICNAIVKTALHRANDILRGKRLTMTDVLDFYQDTFKTPASETISNYLKAYFEERKVRFEKDFDRGDYLSENDIQEDSKFFLDYTLIDEMFK